MRLVYTHYNPALVGLAKSILESSGMAVTIKNEFSGVGIPPYNIDQELWVLDDADYDKAQEILESLDEVDPQEPEDQEAH